MKKTIIFYLISPLILSSCDSRLSICINDNIRVYELENSQGSIGRASSDIQLDDIQHFYISNVREKDIRIISINYYLSSSNKTIVYCFQTKFEHNNCYITVLNSDYRICDDFEPDFDPIDPPSLYVQLSYKIKSFKFYLYKSNN